MSLPEVVPPLATLPDGSMQGRNGWGQIGNEGPSLSPGKPRRYVFKLLALAKTKPLAPGLAPEVLHASVTPRALALAVLSATYPQEP